MIKNLKTISAEDQLKLVLHGTSYAMYEANMDEENYKKWKKNQTEEFSENTIIEMNILETLEELGYPMNELGTYLYKDVIMEVYDKIKDVETRKEIEKCRNLMTELNDCFSSFYHYIAREWKEMGIKTLHLYIEAAIRNRNEDINHDLAKKIYGDTEEENYGLQAFRIAAYIAKKYSFDGEKDYKQPIIKKLPNTPENIVLKDSI